jgi:hypothetical protein
LLPAALNFSEGTKSTHVTFGRLRSAPHRKTLEGVHQ